jgi:hypothetical protein
MSIYTGKRAEPYGNIVCKDDESLGAGSWGWYGAACRSTAYGILHKEYGPKVAQAYFWRFAREWLANQPEEGFQLTSEQLARLLKNYDAKAQASHS